VIVARFADAGPRKYQTTYSNQISSTVKINFQGEPLEDDGDNYEDHFQQLPVLSFEIKNANRFHSVEVILHPDFLPLRPIILISCLRV